MGNKIGEPWENKLAAVLSKEERLDLTKETKVLYLGAGAGKTAAKIAEKCKVVYAVEFAPIPASRLIERAQKNKDFLIPIVEDARNPEKYLNIIEKVDFLYQDVATRGQAEVALENASLFLKKQGKASICVKARSEDVTEEPEKIYEKVTEKLKKEFNILKVIDLEPFYEDHAAIIASKESQDI